MRLRRPFVAWIVLLALLLAGQGPLVAQFAPTSSPLGVALCTVDGVRLVAFGTGDDTPAAPDHAGVPHCPLCAPSHDVSAPPPVPIALAVAVSDATAIRTIAAVAAPAARLLAQSRAQPPPHVLS